MGVAENKAVVRRLFEEVWDQGKADAALDLFHDDYVRHDLRPGKAQAGGAGQAKVAREFRGAFPDLRWRIDLLIGEDDLVTCRWTATGTHTGQWGELPPSGSHVEFSGVNIFRIRDGRIAEVWNHRDDLGLALQTGMPIYAGAAPKPQT